MPSKLRYKINPAAEGEISESIEKLFSGTLGPLIKANAKRIVPVRTGALDRSIVDQTGLEGAEVVLQVGVDEDIEGVDYGGYVEDGTSRQVAQPYLVPAALQAGAKIA